MRDLPIVLLRTFVVVASTLNLTTAAQRLHRAPSTISMQLTRLEALVAAELLQRGQYGVRLTPAGEQLKSCAQELLNLHDRILGTFRHADVGGQVRLGTHDQYATRNLAPLLETFVLSYPEANLEVVCDHRPEYLASLVAEGKLDLALVEMPALSDGGQRLFRDELVWCATRHIRRTSANRCRWRSLPRAAITVIRRARPWATRRSRTGSPSPVRAGLASWRPYGQGSVWGSFPVRPWSLVYT